MKEKWLVSFGITHIVFLSFVLTFAVKNALLFYSLKTNVMTVLLITHPGIPNIYAVPTVKGYIGSIVP